MQVSFLGPTYGGKNISIDPSRCINFYPEINPNTSSKSQIALIGTPGTAELFDTSKPNVRGFHELGGVLYIVAGNSFLKWVGGVLSALGTLNTSSGRVSIKDNGIKASGVGGDQIAIVDGVDGYIYNISDNTFTVIPTGASGEIRHITIESPGSGYTSAPTITLANTGGGSGATFDITMGPIDTEVVTVGSGYEMGDLVSILGNVADPGNPGSNHDQMVLEVEAIAANPVALNAAGTGYVAGDEVSLASGTGERPMVINVDTIGGGGAIATYSVVDYGSYTVAPTISNPYKAYSVVLTNTGSGYTVGDVVKLKGGTKTTAVAITIGSVGVGGEIIGYTITATGAYTKTPLQDGATKGGTGSGAVMKVVWMTELDMEGGTGTGATFDVVWGVAKTVVVSAGMYEEPVTATLDQDDDNSATIGTGAQFTIGWGLVGIVVTDGGSGYATSGITATATGGGSTTDVELNDPSVRVTNGGFPTSPVMLEYLDGYFIVIDESMTHHTSDLYDGTQWNPLAAASVIATPDNNKAVVSQHQQLYFIKGISTEVWYDAAVPTTQGSPFARLQGVVIDFGTAAPWSVAKGTGTIFFLGTQKANDRAEFAGVMQLSGYTAQVISPPAINHRIGELSVISDAFGYVWLHDGHEFYVLTFPSGNMTLVYDATTMMWHEWSTFAELTDPAIRGRHIGNCYVYWGNKHVVGDYKSGKVYEVSDRYYTDNGAPILSTRIAPIIHDRQDFADLFMYRFYIDAELGMHDPSVIEEPKAVLSWSRDGGRTYGDGYEASMGKVGEFTTRLMWRRLGYSRDMVFNLTISDPIRKVLVNTFADVG